MSCSFVSLGVSSLDFVGIWDSLPDKCDAHLKSGNGHFYVEPPPFLMYSYFSSLNLFNSLHI